MFGSSQQGANAYAKVGVETGVTSASPHRLIVMLYDGALVAVSSAMQHMKTGNVAEKGKSISKAILIIDNGLRASLNKDAGGAIALNLDSLYEYMSTQLLHANLKNQPELLEEVYGLLLELKSAWDAIAAVNTANSTETSTSPLPKPSAYDSLAPRTSSLVRA